MNSEIHITDLIPQRTPMVMIDRLVESTDDHTVSEFVPQSNNIFSDGHYFTEPGLIENMAQTVALRAGHKAFQENVKPDIGFIGAVKRLEIIKLPKINTKLVTEIIVTSNLGDILVVNGKITVDNELVLQGDMNIFIQKNSTV